MIRNQAKDVTISLVPGIRLDTNPIAQPAGTARVLRNKVFERKALRRKEFSPEFTSPPFTAGSSGTIETSATLAGAGATQSDGDAATPAWSNASNITASDDAYATATFGVGTQGNTEYIRANNFGFSIPTDATIVGVVASIEGKRTANSTSTYLGEAVLVVNGAQAGVRKLVTAFTTTDSTITVGTYNNKWNVRGLTPALVNDSAFGIDVRYTLERVLGSGAETFSIDAISLTVYYSYPVWRITDFQYTRASAPYSKCIIFRANGKVYERQSSGEQEIFPAHYGFSALTAKPFVGVLPNRLFFSDGEASYVYDGRTVRVWGIARSTTAPTLTAQNLGGSIAAATGVKGVVTWVVQDEAGNRVHESSRSNVGNAAFLVISGVDDSVRFDITALTPPSGTTHWSAYVSELDGSEVFRRAATTPIGTLTVDISAFPAATTARAPERNDPPPPTTVGGVAKNRMFMRDDANPNNFYFSALGEVLGLANGSAEESFPGYGTNSVSDLSNNDNIVERELRAIAEHENIVALFGRDRGYALIGEMNLLDNRAPRSLLKLQQFPEGCAGPDAAVSTPYGLVWMTPQRKMYLWSSGQDLHDIGQPIQKILDSVTAEDLPFVHMQWWGGNGRQWLLVSMRSRPYELSSLATSAEPKHRIMVYDFAYLTPKGNNDYEQGSWMEWADIEATCFGVWRDTDGTQFLLSGDLFGHVRQLDTMCQPSHLNLSMRLGRAYLGSTPQNNPATEFWTGLMHPDGDVWTVVQYLTLTLGDEMSPGGGVRYPPTGSPALTNGSLTAPTVAYSVDSEIPEQAPATAMTLDTALSTQDQRAWIGDGKLCKNANFRLAWAAGVDTATETSSSRTVAMFNAIYKLSLTHSRKKEDTV